MRENYSNIVDSPSADRNWIVLNYRTFYISTLCLLRQARRCRSGAVQMARAERARLGAHARLPPPVCGARARAEPAASRRLAPTATATASPPAQAPAGTKARAHKNTNTCQGRFHGLTRIQRGWQRTTYIKKCFLLFQIYFKT